jgi:hypothetical protein
MRSAVPPAPRRAPAARPDGRWSGASVLLGLVAALFFAVPAAGTPAPGPVASGQRAGTAHAGASDTARSRHQPLADRGAPGAPVLTGERVAGKLLPHGPVAVLPPGGVATRAGVVWPAERHTDVPAASSVRTQRGRGPPAR